jgi:hypothetical protein
LQRPIASLAPLGRVFTAERQGRWPYHSQPQNAKHLSARQSSERLSSGAERF